MAPLSGKVALITGAGRGIGAGIARRLAADGASVIINYARSAAPADDLQRELVASGRQATTVAANIATLDGINDLFAQLAQANTRLDILVNNAGAGSGGMPRLEQTTVEDFDATFALNTRAVFFVTQHAVSIMNDGGRVISLSSTSTSTRTPGLSAYAGSKASIEAFGRIWATELASRGITVNTVLPGIVNTDMIRNSMSAAQAQAFAASVPMGRMGEPDDIAAVVAFLASEDARWITGQTIVANGGA